MVSYERQTDGTDSENVPLSKQINDPAPVFAPVVSSGDSTRDLACDGDPGNAQTNDLLVLPGTNVTLDSSTATRPKADGIAFPFKLKRSLLPNNNMADTASVMTLRSEAVSLEDENQTEALKRPEVERFETAHEKL